MPWKSTPVRPLRGARAAPAFAITPTRPTKCGGCGGNPVNPPTVGTSSSSQGVSGTSSVRSAARRPNRTGVATQSGDWPAIVSGRASCRARVRSWPCSSTPRYNVSSQPDGELVADRVAHGQHGAVELTHQGRGDGRELGLVLPLVFLVLIGGRFLTRGAVPQRQGRGRRGGAPGPASAGSRPPWRRPTSRPTA